jgi:purine nucleoside permease
MHSFLFHALVVLLSSLLVPPTSLAAQDAGVAMKERSYTYKAKPKAFTISMFPPEGEVWWGIPEFDLLATNIMVPGFSPLFPDAHCTVDGDICQLVTGESGGCLFPTVLIITFGIS